MADQFLRFQFGSHFRDGFDAQQRLLLGERNRVWNLLATASNTHTKELGLVLTNSNPVLAKAYEDVNADASNQNKINLRSILNELRPKIFSQDAKLNISISEIVSQSGIWWQNRDCLYTDFTRALRTNKNYLNPISHRPRDSDSGNFSYRFQKSVRMEDLESGRLPVQIIRDGKHAVIRMPIHANGFGQYIHAQWPFTWHRNLPENCLIRGVNVIGKIVGAEWRLSISILIQKNIELTLKREKICGIDVGWRMGPSGLRVATAAINGKFHDLSLSANWVQANDYVTSLDSLLDSSCELAWKQTTNEVVFPGWLVAEKKLLNATSPAWLEWLLSTHNMRRERKNKLARLMRERLDVYRKFAADLVKNCDVIHVEKLDLRRLLAKDSKQGPQQKRQQRLAAISILHQCIEHACERAGTVFRRVEAYQTTVKHIKCGFLNKPSLDQMISCLGCGEIYDQDSNAALNIAVAVKFKK